MLFWFPGAGEGRGIRLVCLSSWVRTSKVAAVTLLKEINNTANIINPGITKHFFIPMKSLYHSILPHFKVNYLTFEAFLVV